MFNCDRGALNLERSLIHITHNKIYSTKTIDNKHNTIVSLNKICHFPMNKLHIKIGV